MGTSKNNNTQQTTESESVQRADIHVKVLHDA